jgi:uridylate kinase, putative
MSEKKIVVSVGGSVLVPGDHDSEYIEKLALMIEDVSKDIQLVIVCGGGKIARYYTETGKELGGTTRQLDILGIGATRLNAGLLAIALGDLSSTDIPLTAKDAAARSVPGKVVVMGGTEPGHTTDAVAAMVAKEMHADRIINATSVDAVYSDDPRKNPDAKRLSKLTIEELGNLVYKEHGAGRSSVFDPLGVKIASEEHIDILIVDGRDLKELKNSILGKEIKGTFIDSH